jgi:hypothetical protein
MLLTTLLGKHLTEAWQLQSCRAIRCALRPPIILGVCLPQVGLISDILPKPKPIGRIESPDNKELLVCHLTFLPGGLLQPARLG